MFFPPTTCVENCTDTLVINSTPGYGFYSDIEGTRISMCAKCHPYCKACTGGYNT